MDEIEKCETCLFAIETGFVNNGKKGLRCQRFPPTVVFVGSDQSVKSKFPGVVADMWCGEYERVENE